VQTTPKFYVNLCHNGFILSTFLNIFTADCSYCPDEVVEAILELHTLSLNQKVDSPLFNL